MYVLQFASKSFPNLHKQFRHKTGNRRQFRIQIKCYIQFVLYNNRSLIFYRIMDTVESYVYILSDVDGWKLVRHYTVKKVFLIFPSPAGMSLTKLSLGRNNDVIYKLFSPIGRVW